MHLKNVYCILLTQFVLKSQIKITKNFKSVPNCSAYIFGPVDIMVIGLFYDKIKIKKEWNNKIESKIKIKERENEIKERN